MAAFPSEPMNAISTPPTFIAIPWMPAGSPPMMLVRMIGQSGLPDRRA